MIRTVVVSQLGPEIDEVLSGHTSRPLVRPLSERERPWALTEPADALLTRPFAPGWREAPAARPPGWPGPLRWVMTASTGVDFFLGWLTDGPVVSCARGVSAGPIAEFALAAILAHAKHSDTTRMLSRADFRQVELESIEGQTLGLAGFGAIAQALAGRARALGMQVLLQTLALGSDARGRRTGRQLERTRRALRSSGAGAPGHARDAPYR
jgi:phosphoglycerate dehydrogenase-like enzyme